MGYYTSYTLEVIEGDEGLIELFRQSDGEAVYAIGNDVSSYEDIKWYGHEKDLKRFSAQYPEALFKLSGTGEESPDIWIKYFRNGKVQFCKAMITFDEFNANLLK